MSSDVKADVQPFALWRQPLKRFVVRVAVALVGAAAVWGVAVLYAGSPEAARTLVPIAPIMTFFVIAVIMQKGELSEDPLVPVGERRAAAMLFAVLILLWMASTPAMVPS